MFRHPDTGDFHAFATGRVNTGPTDRRGVIARARSTDLTQWEVLSPLTEPGDFGQLECSQLLRIQARTYLLFSTFAWTTAGSFYGGRLVQGPDDTWYFLVWRYFTPGGDFVGALPDPMPLTIEDD